MVSTNIINHLNFLNKIPDMKSKIKKLNDYEWLVPKGSRPRMNVDAKIIANKKILDSLEDDAIQQLTNVACLPGVQNPVIGLADMHWGYIISFQK